MIIHVISAWAVMWSVHDIDVISAWSVSWSVHDSHVISAWSFTWYVCDQPRDIVFLQHWTLLLSSVTLTTGHCFHFGSISSFFLELLLHSSPVAYWAPTNLRSSSFSILSFCPFILFMGFQGKNTEVVCHSLLQWTTFCQNSPPWPSHLRWSYSTRLIVSLS